MEMISNSEIDCLVFQMGKVGSTAIVEALNAAGQLTEQVHFLSGKSIDGIVRRFKTRTDLPDWSAWHSSHQLAKSLRLHNLVHSYKSGKYDRRLKIITMTRHPVSWWVSEFFQNWEVNKIGLLDWNAANGSKVAEENLCAENIVDFFHAVFDRITESGDITEFVRCAQDESLAENSGVNALNSTGLRLLRPTTWFDEFFKDDIGVDLLANRFDRAIGYHQTQLTHFDILLLRYEDLGDVAPIAFDKFFGKKLGLKLLRSNTTTAKLGINSLYPDVKKKILLSEDFKNLLASTRYCSNFYPEGMKEVKAEKIRRSSPRSIFEGVEI